MQSTTERIWDNMLDVERLSRYYGKIADRYQKRHLGLSMLSILGSLAAAAWLLSPADFVYSDAISAALFMVVAMATSAMIVYDFSRKAQIARTTSELVREIGVGLNRLWHDEEPDIRTIEELESRIDAVTRNDLPVDYELNESCNDEAYRVVENFHPREERGRGTGRRLAAETVKT